MTDDNIQDGIGQPVQRIEDRRLITGKGCYADDNKPANMAWLNIVRSLYPHAIIEGIDCSIAIDMAGVLTVLTGEDYQNDRLGDIPCISIPPGVMNGNWFRIQTLLAEHIFKIPTHQIHVQCKDVGGGFGTKGNLYPEEALVLWAAKRVGRPVKWLSDRSESFLSDFNGRDQIADAELALDKEGNILALRANTYTNMGCQQGPSGAHPPLIGARMLSGAYAIPAMHVRAHGVLTHTMTLTTYRGAGRPEATFLLERNDRYGRAGIWF